MLSSNAKQIIENIVIKYRFNFKQEQDPKKIFSVAMGSEAKSEIVKDIKNSQTEIAEIVKEINSWPESKIEDEFNKRNLEDKKEKVKKTLVFPKMENIIDGKVKTTYPPEPSKYPHIGHAYACVINYRFAKEHNGKFVIRFEDTNPKLAKKEYYNLQLEGYNWLGIKANEIIYASDYMDLLYKKAEELINKEKAYVCLCNSEDVRNKRQKKESCECSKNLKEKNLELWTKLLNKEFKEGEASLRLIGDMTSPQAEFRDPVLLRISYLEHARTKNKYHLWPSYIFQNTILDCELGVTHRFRSKEFEVWKPVQKYLANLLDYIYPEVFEFARVNLVNGIASGRKLRETIEQGNMAWDDPSLTTLVALRRRGFLPESIIEFIDKMGVSKTESTIEWSVLDSINRKLLAQKDIKKIACFEKPIKVKVKDENNFLEKKLLEIYIDEKTQFAKEYKLRNTGNVILENKVLKALPNEQKKGLNMLPFALELQEIKVIMPCDLDDLNREKILFVDAQAYSDLKENDIVILDGFAYCRLDNKEKNIFIFSHE
jgi:glutamyl-tRNA synthetase